ncbi:putative mannitol dehydrogenase [Camellia lanceoleosa]|uniref:Mannitol dehydrogenase n=1 Tax=Camellia lanceoleosa TaxID=1840588 RepID=A0ACC0I7H6_9ERIC|nr:putative mannitol dehydrogenase [Camellia lanceoleosa]
MSATFNSLGGPLYHALEALRHEIVGVVIEVGSKVQKFKVGDKVGVGSMVGCCHSCDNCANDLENYCPKMLLVYNSIYYDGTPTYGAVKFAKAFGVKVTVFSTSPDKKKEAIERLGADSFLDSRDPTQMQVVMGTMDGIIDTISAPHPLLPLIGLLKSHGKLILVGAPEKALELPVFALLMGRKIVAGSCIGGIKEIQEMIDFAAKHNITAGIEVIPMDYVNTAMERLVKADVRYRFVIDIGNTLKIA